MKIIALIPETWKIDGGVAFGVIPKSLWGRFFQADEENLINMSNTCLLVDEGDRCWLIDTGFGNKRDEKYYRFKYITQRKSWESILQSHGYHCGDITDILFTHLHDDHCGGAVFRDNSGSLNLQFPNACYHIGREQFDSFVNPNPREAAAYFKDNMELIMKTDRIVWIDEEKPLSEGIRVIIRHGHTKGLIIPFISYENETIVFANDFIPSPAHIPPVWIASVDIDPIKALQEKEIFLNEAYEKNWILFFEHVLGGGAAKIDKDIKGFIGEEIPFENIF